MEVEGNRGYLAGEPTEDDQEESKLGDTRTVTVVEVELGGPRPEDEVLGKPKAYKEPQGEESTPREEVEGVIEEEVMVEELMIEEPQVQEVPQEYEQYTVQKNDTLQKISRKFYGTTKKWYKIYKANRDVIKNPDKVYPGLKIKIPVAK